MSIPTVALMSDVADIGTHTVGEGELSSDF